MDNLMDTEQPNWLVILFFVFLVIICSLFMLNVVLAIFGDSLDRSESIQQKQDNLLKNKIAKSVKRAQAMLSEIKSIKM